MAAIFTKIAQNGSIVYGSNNANPMERTWRRLRLALAAALLVAPVTAQAPQPRCADYDSLKQPFFGSTHVHTGRSFDASINQPCSGDAARRLPIC